MRFLKGTLSMHERNTIAQIIKKETFDVANNIAEKIADLAINGTDDELITLLLCIELAKKEKSKNSRIKYLVMSLKSVSEGADGTVILTLSFIDNLHQPVIIDSHDSNSYVFTTQTKNIDNKIIELFNKEKTVIIQMQ